MARLCSFGLSLALLTEVDGSASVAATPAPGRENYTFFCEYQCKDKLSSDCFTNEANCKPPDASCSLIGTQPFYSNRVCSQYAASQPPCDAKTKDCDEAAEFQLIVDRFADMSRVFEGKDYLGVGKLFQDDAMVFSPGNTKFLRQPEIPASFKKLHEDGPKINFVTKQVLSVKKTKINESIVHSFGTWESETKNAPKSGVPVYARWHLNGTDWLVESMIMMNLPEPDEARRVVDDDLFKAISKRATDYADLYNSGNYSDLVKQLYAPGAAIFPATGKPMSTLDGDAAAERFFATAPLGKATAKLTPTIVTMATDAKGKSNGVAHEIGYSSSTDTGYYARWVYSTSKEWMIESHCFAVFPNSTALLSSDVIVI